MRFPYSLPFATTCLLLAACQPAGQPEQAGPEQGSSDVVAKGELVAEPPPEGTPRLILFISIDQFGSEPFARFEPLFSGGLRWLLDNGVRFDNATHLHARTETAPGHATISTGRFPSGHGIISNYWNKPGVPERYGAVDDDEYEESPRNLLTSTFGGWLKDLYPSARVFATSAKDRAAILLGGKEADGAFWYDADNGVFETSDYYDEPEWLGDFNRAMPHNRFYGEAWEPLPLSDSDLDRLELEELELGPLRSEFPHVFGGTRPAPIESFYWGLYYSPLMDVHLADFSRRLMEQEGLGEDPVPDLMAIGFSAPDAVGHQYGQHSREYVDVILRLDQTLGELFEFIDAKVGLENTVIAMTSDHGVAPVPEVQQKRGLPGWRPDAETILCLQRVGRGLAEQFGVDEWLISGPFLAPGLEEATGRSRGELEAMTEVRLEACPHVYEVWTRSQLMSTEEGDSLEQRFYRASFHPDRSPDFLIRFEEYFMRSRTMVTSHGTSYAYDRDVPLVLVSPRLEPRRIEEPIATVDLAPTAAALLGIPFPDDLDGRDLSELVRPADQ